MRTQFFTVVTHKKKIPIKEAIAQINDWQNIFRTVSTTP